MPSIKSPSKLGRKAGVCRCDVVDEASVNEMSAQARKFFDDQIDILVNVAGVTGPIETPVQNIKPDDFTYVIEANIRGTYLPIKNIVPTMIERKSGKIVNISGTSGLRGCKYRAAYSSSKWSVRGLTRTVALEVGEYGINCNVVCPGIVHTPRSARFCLRYSAVDFLPMPNENASRTPGQCRTSCDNAVSHERRLFTF